MEVAVGEDEKCESTNIYSGVTASSREGSNLKISSLTSLGTHPPDKSWLRLWLLEMSADAVSGHVKQKSTITQHQKENAKPEYVKSSFHGNNNENK